MTAFILGILTPLLATAPHGGGGGSEPAGAPELPNVITLLSARYHDVPFISFLHHWENVIFAFIVAAGLSILAYFATRHKSLMPGRLQNLLEMAVEGLDNFFAGVLGPQGRRFTPF
ncbi:MAG TPA: hypothetical protein VM118_14485, partial [Acidobacteriota bacterium]|nr:hypothetical protein [Acidobacteriota bacterium]